MDEKLVVSKGSFFYLPNGLSRLTFLLLCGHTYYRGSALGYQKDADGLTRTDPILPRAMRMLQNYYTQIPFPYDGPNQYPLAICIRKAS